MYLMLLGLDMEGHDSLTLTSLSLLLRYINVLCMWTLFLLLNTFCHTWSRLVTLCHELLYTLGFEMNTLSITLVYATQHNLTVDHVR
jgi:hypothetical protein